jgi:hypothetical protein
MPTDYLAAQFPYQDVATAYFTWQPPQGNRDRKAIQGQAAILMTDPVRWQSRAMFKHLKPDLPGNKNDTEYPSRRPDGRPQQSGVHMRTLTDARPVRRHQPRIKMVTRSYDRTCK